MIINPFAKQGDKNEEISNDICKIKKEEINLKEIQKYLIDNYLELIKDENRDLLEKEIRKYIYEKYYIDKEEKITIIVNKIFNKMFGYDILQKYIDNIHISDIRAVKYNLIYVKEKGIWKKVNESFLDEETFYEYIRYCVLKNGSNINFDIPIIIISDKKYNLRIEAGIRPVNSLSPSIVIRIHRNDNNINLESLTFKEEMLSVEIYNFLCKIVKNNKNIVLSGKGGSGKTTLLRSLINKLPEETAITCNEETTELYLKNRNVIQREVIENRDEDKKITLEKLTRHSLVMSNDVIIVGELKRSRSYAVF